MGGNSSSSLPFKKVLFNTGLKKAKSILDKEYDKLSSIEIVGKVYRDSIIKGNEEMKIGDIIKVYYYDYYDQKLPHYYLLIKSMKNEFTLSLFTPYDDCRIEKYKAEKEGKVFDKNCNEMLEKSFEHEAPATALQTSIPATPATFHK